MPPPFEWPIYGQIDDPLNHELYCRLGLDECWDCGASWSYEDEAEKHWVCCPACNKRANMLDALHSALYFERDSAVDVLCSLSDLDEELARPLFKKLVDNIKMDAVYDTVDILKGQRLDAATLATEVCNKS